MKFRPSVIIVIILALFLIKISIADSYLSKKNGRPLKGAIDFSSIPEE